MLKDKILKKEKKDKQLELGIKGSPVEPLYTALHRFRKVETRMEAIPFWQDWAVWLNFCVSVIWFGGLFLYLRRIFVLLPDQIPLIYIAISDQGKIAGKVDLWLLLGGGAVSSVIGLFLAYRIFNWSPLFARCILLVSSVVSFLVGLSFLKIVALVT